MAENRVQWDISTKQNVDVDKIEWFRQIRITILRFSSEMPLSKTALFQMTRRVFEHRGSKVPSKQEFASQLNYLYEEIGVLTIRNKKYTIA